MYTYTYVYICIYKVNIYYTIVYMYVCMALIIYIIGAYLTMRVINDDLLLFELTQIQCILLRHFNTHNFIFISFKILIYIKWSGERRIYIYMLHTYIN